MAARCYRYLYNKNYRKRISIETFHFASLIYLREKDIFLDMALVIRNITSRPIELKQIEKSESSPNLGGGTIGNITSNFSSLLRLNNTQSSVANQQSVSTVDLSLILPPFTTTRTEIQLGPNKSLHLTFEIESERHRLENLTPSTSSTVLTPLSEEPRFNFTATYLAQASHLTIYSSANLSSWMRALKDETPLAALSIPGTHNSPTCHRALPSVRCQATSPPEQLQNGVRFFDIRVQPENPEDLTKDGLVLVHSVFPISLTGPKYLRGLIDEVFTFLDQNPSETVIMSIKREGTGNANDAQLSRILRDHYAGDVNRWFTAPRIPTLGEARHKIVLIRRFTLEEGLKNEWGGAGWCIDAANWADNTPNATCSSGDVCVQDFYEVLDTQNIDKKLKYSEEHLARSSQCVCALPEPGALDAGLLPKQPFYINFLTASNFWKVGCWPEKIAAKLNPAIFEYLCLKHNETEGVDLSDEEKEAVKRGDGGTGIVVCDWVGYKGDWDLVKCIVAMNASLELREQNL